MDIKITLKSGENERGLGEEARGEGMFDAPSGRLGAARFGIPGRETGFGILLGSVSDRSEGKLQVCELSVILVGVVGSGTKVFDSAPSRSWRKSTVIVFDTFALVRGGFSGLCGSALGRATEFVVNLAEAGMEVLARVGRRNVVGKGVSKYRSRCFSISFSSGSVRPTRSSALSVR